jgi:6-pyruvoyltetrahydropterin/6-carboxytetrahydropterin synthase
MHRLTREIRFTVSPFCDAGESANSYCSRPDCEGMGLFFSLWVELGGDIDPQTGFVVNLSDIDKVCRGRAVPLIESAVKDAFKNGRNISLTMLSEMLKDCCRAVRGRFLPAKVLSMAINVNPYRNVKICTENDDVIHYSEKFEFAAMHKLWNDDFSEAENFARFGKCANPTGHGHNYIVEVKVKVLPGSGFTYGRLAKIVDRNLIELLDHKNLNEDVADFKQNNPTVENITTFAWQALNGKFGNAELEEIIIWENDRAYCSYRNEQ